MGSMKSLFETFSSIFSKAPQEPKGHKGWSLIGFIIIGLLAGVYFFHVNTQQEYLTKRNFRILELWNQELSKKIQSFEAVFDISAEHSPPQLREDLQEEGKIGIFGPGENGTKEIAKWIDLSCFNGHKVGHDPDLEPYFLVYRNLCDTGLSSVSLKLHSSTSESSSEGLSISTPQDKQQSTFRLSYKRRLSRSDPKNTKTLLITSQLNLEAFLDRLTKESIFDDVLIFNSKGNVIFQQSSVEFNWSNWGQLWHHKISEAPFSLFNLLDFGTNQESTKPSPQAYTKSNLVNVEPLPTSFTISISDASYQVFAQPTDLLSNDHHPLVICGVIDTDRFRQNTLAISSTALLILMVILGLLILSLPLLRLKMIGPTDPLRLSHMFMLVFSSFLGTGLLTFLLLDFVIYREAKSVINHQIEETADSIQSSVHNEIGHVLKTLKDFDTSTDFHTHFTKLEKSELEERSKKQNTHKTHDGKKSPQSVLLEEGLDHPCVHSQYPKDQEALTPECYPHYLYAFWIDENGTLRINWTNKNDHGIAWKGVINNISLRNRQYVDQVLNHKNTLWRWNSEDFSQQFYLEPITSWNTGWNSVVASMPSQTATSSDDRPWVAAMEFQFLSLMKNLVLPPQAGFAVIHNHDYQVLFHSTSTKNLREDFWAETEYDPYLRDLVFARTPGHFDGKYWGEDTHFYVLPIEPMPWSIVVFQKKEMLRSVNFVILLISGGVFGIWAIIALAGAAYLMGLFQWEKHRKAKWLWPNKEHEDLYLGITVANAVACFIGLVLAWAWGASPGPLLVIGLLYPLFVAIVLAGMLTYSSNVIKNLAKVFGKSSKSAFPTSYAYMMTSLLVLGAVLPAFFVFKAVFFQEMSLVVKHQLMDLYSDSQSRQFSGYAQPASHTLSSFSRTHGLSDCRTPFPDHSQSLPYGMYPNAFLKTHWYMHSSNCPREDSPLFDSFYRFWSQPFVTLRKGIQEWGFLHTANSANGSVTRLPFINQDESTISLTGPITYNANRNSPVPSKLTIWADVPLRPWILLFSWPKLTGADIPLWLLSMVLFVGYARTLYRIPRFIADQVLFLSYTVPIIGTFPPKLIQEENGNTPNLLILGYPGQGKTSQFLDRENATAQQPLYTDLRAITAKDLKSIEEDCENESNPVVVVDHFDWRWDEPKINQRKLEFLEKLLGWHREPEFIASSNLKTNYPGSDQPDPQRQPESQRNSHHVST